MYIENKHEETKQNKEKKDNIDIIRQNNNNK
jgi:hypothetical protein